MYNTCYRSILLIPWDGLKELIGAHSGILGVSFGLMAFLNGVALGMIRTVGVVIYPIWGHTIKSSI